mgnify:CR=1 FL=1
MSFTPDHLAPHVPKIRAAGHCFIGYSGGLDSHVLLSALVKLLGGTSITAVHINHQLSKNARAWQQHCQSRCDEMGVAMVTETVTVENSGQGLEQAAREARYSVFETLLTPSDLMLLAHHADDQVETVLYRLLRGSGPKGLAGMPQNRSLGKGELLRPLLSFSRSELEQYARAEGLSWIEDESNQDISFDRNFLRNKVVPVIAERWPDYPSRVAHSAALCGESDQLAEVLAAQDLIAVYERHERIGWSIALEPMMALDVSRQGNLLRHWAGQHQLPQPGHRIVDTVLHELLPARQDAEPLVSWAGVQLRRFHRRLYLLPVDVDTPDQLPASLEWNTSEDIVLPDKSELLITTEQGRGLRLPEEGMVEIRFRGGGERCTPVGRNGSNTLKKLFQEYGLEPWLRNRVPLIYVQGQLAAVGDLWVCDSFSVTEGESGLAIQWRFPLSI